VSAAVEGLKSALSLLLSVSNNSEESRSQNTQRTCSQYGVSLNNTFLIHFIK
jgi:hypothetical protein